jgi:uncharacterized repeat protein (TIGR03803 family)
MRCRLSFIFLVILSSFVKAQNPILWGMTNEGGVNHAGIIFSFNCATGIETDRHDFGEGTDGKNPFGSLMQASNGLLYGMTTLGGINDSGTIFSYDISKGVEKDLHDFDGADGKAADCSFIQANNGLLYGMTNAGGTNNAGTIFSYTISSGIETKLHDFGAGTDGKNPYGSLIQVNDSLLYGMTQVGGKYKAGTIFSYNISSGIETDLHDFGSGTDGQYADASLIRVSDSLLYGMTSTGGIYEAGIGGDGTIFSYNIYTGAETDVHDFGNGTDGIQPLGSPMQASNGLLYGMTETGGIENVNGSIFSYNILDDSEIKLHDFGNGTDGADPFGSLIQGSNGLIYGMTTFGGKSDSGTIFSYNIEADSEMVIYNLGSGTDGGVPFGSLIEADTPEIATGINHLTNSEIISLYPNPSSSSIRLSLNLQNEQPVTLSLYNTMGQQVWAEDLGKTKDINTIIPLTNLANGVYILKVNSGGESEQEEVGVAR